MLIAWTWHLLQFVLLGTKFQRQVDLQCIWVSHGLDKVWDKCTTARRQESVYVMRETSAEENMTANSFLLSAS